MFYAAVLFLIGIFFVLVWWACLAARAGVRMWRNGEWRLAPWMGLLTLILLFGASAVVFASYGQLIFMHNVREADLKSLGTFEFEGVTKHLYQNGDLLCVGVRDFNDPVIEQCFEEPLD